MMRRTAWLIVLLCVSAPSTAGGDITGLRYQASQALGRATEFFRSQVATEGGYLWRYSEDLSRREGEGRASATTVWVQPPGTPSIGIAFLEAHHATGEQVYLEAAKEAGYCLVRGQLRSGGWDYRVCFDPQERKRYAYRADKESEGKKLRNTTTLDDNVTQAALRLLMRLDKTLNFKDAKIHEAAVYGLDSLIAAQYPNGASPQRYDRPPDARKFPVVKASYPESWSRTYERTGYASHYTFNDNAISDVIDVMFEADRTYQDPKYAAAARKAGDFILLAQMPEPQPGWAQQYDAQMHPAWARKFEPPGICGGEPQGVMRSLLQIYRQTGDKKYLEPLPRAIAYYRKSLLPDGQLARYYELKTNRPLYFTKKYELTYSDDDTPTHYAFKVGNGLDSIQREYKRLLALGPKALRPQPPTSRAKPSKRLIAQTRAVISALDDRGRWVEDGRMNYHGDDDPTRRVIDCRTFISNLRVLSNYLATAPE